MEISVSLQTDSGCVRDSNEDAGLSFMPSDPIVLARKGGLVILADGMGGHSGGEIASKLAVEAITRVYYEVDNGPAESLRIAFEQANRQIYEASIADANLEGMGTTSTALVLCGESAIAAHVGDSRLYLLRDGEIYQMTEDHSVVMEMVKQGIITTEQARHHEDKNVIVRALGTGPQVEISIWEKPLAVRDGDQFILCSDGLYDLVEDKEIRDLVLANGNHSACEELISLAKKRGGYDNITVGILSVKPSGYQEAKNPRVTREAEVVL
jgi:PPM family protein phosphatase